MHYVQFYTKNLKGKTVEKLGSDGVFILDGRNKLSIMIKDAKNRIHKLKNVASDIIGFEIRQGNIFSYSVLYESKEV